MFSWCYYWSTGSGTTILPAFAWYRKRNSKGYIAPCFCTRCNRKNQTACIKRLFRQSYIRQATKLALMSVSQLKNDSIDGATGLAIEDIRKQFPVLHQEVNGHPLIYFDNAATT